MSTLPGPPAGRDAGGSADAAASGGDAGDAAQPIACTPTSAITQEITRSRFKALSVGPILAIAF